VRFNHVASIIVDPDHGSL